ncbi:molybdate-anion transporter [Naviculisporaceae sp. PSN 640]
MDIYTLNLASLLAVCGALFVRGRAQSQSQSQSQSQTNKPASPTTPTTTSTSKTTTTTKPPSNIPFLTVYALVMASDWLQGPFLYPLYQDEHRLPHGLISALFTTGFLSGAVSGAFIGSLADKYGRKKACLFFCVAYALSCLYTSFPSLGGVLFLSKGAGLVLGRVLGGLSTSLLFSVFESWMVADFTARGGNSGLSEMFGTMSMVNSLVAIGSGVVSEWLVGMSGTKKAPFLASVVLLCGAFGVISLSWDEYYGSKPTESAEKKDKDGEESATTPKPNTSTLGRILSDPRILCLGLASTIFEGSMYLFVFFWTPTLRSTLSSSSSSSSSLPYGVIFASFMASCLAASLAFNTFMSSLSSTSPSSANTKHPQPMLTHPTLLLLLLATSSITFFLSAHPSSEQVTFWVFCVYEAAVGAYWPTMGTLKGRLIDDSIRSQVYGLLRVPLNVFVVVSLILTGDGAAGFAKVFETCGMLLSGTVGVLFVARGAL